MIQFNLLPDVKIDYIKARKAKRMVMAVAALSVAVAFVLLIILVSATLFQKKHIKDLDKDISSNQSSLQDTPDLTKILTIQNQLNSLPALYAQRPVTSRLFNYVQATTPKQVSIIKLKLDFTDSSFTIDGTADSLESMNRYVDTLKFTTFTATGSDTKKPAFNNVILKVFNRDAKIATYTIGTTFDIDIFDGAKAIKLNVPQTITTRSQTELPSVSTGVFDAARAR